MLKEAEWLRNKSVPTVDEYMENAYISFALGPIVLPAVYLVGPKLPEESVRHLEFHNLYKLMSTSGRLLNDIRGFEVHSFKDIGTVILLTSCLICLILSIIDHGCVAERIQRRETECCVIANDS